MEGPREMIPAGREAVNSAGAAALMGMTQKQFQNAHVWERPGAPKPFKEGARRPLYDRAQWEAFAAGRELPVWKVGTREDPLDLLDQDESAEFLEIETSTVRSYATSGHLTRVDVCGVTHFRRRELAERKANPGVAGRPRTRSQE